MERYKVPFLKDFILSQWLSSSGSQSWHGERKWWAQGLRFPELSLHHADSFGEVPPPPLPAGLEGAVLGSWSPHLVAALGKEAMTRSSDPAVLFLTQIRERDVARGASCHGNTN